MTMGRGLAIAAFIIGVVSVLCGTAATVLGAVGMYQNRWPKNT